MIESALTASSEALPYILYRSVYFLSKTMPIVITFQVKSSCRFLISAVFHVYFLVFKRSL